MEIKSGIDIVSISRFQKSLKNAGPSFLQRVFLSQELVDHNITNLASVFAAKEAVMKALSLSTDSWHKIKVSRKRDGAPLVEVLNHEVTIESSSLSISHDGDYVIACFVAILKK